jgi:hypothetical protein
MRDTQLLTQLEFDEEDFPIAEAMAKRLGYTQTAYTSSSALWGLFCLPDRAWTLPHKRGGCIIKTLELGFLWVQDQEDIGFERDSGVEAMSAEDGKQWARRTVAKAEVRK